MTVRLDTNSGMTFGWVDGQDNWGNPVNEAFQHLAYAGNHVRVLGFLNSPLSSNSLGDRYLVGETPAGDWSTYTKGDLVVWGYDSTGVTAGWQRFSPIIGMLVYNTGVSTAYDQASEFQDKLLVHTGSGTWVEVSGGGGLATVVTDSTLMGDGSADTPLTVTISMTTDEKTKLGNLDASRQLPAGGTEDQLLSKTADDDYSVGWVDAPTPTILPDWAERRQPFSGTIGGPRPSSLRYSTLTVLIMHTPLNTSFASLLNADHETGLYPSITNWPMLGVYGTLFARDALGSWLNSVEARILVYQLVGSQVINLVSSTFKLPDAITGIVESPFLPCYHISDSNRGTWVTDFYVAVELRTRNVSALTFPHISAHATAGVYTVARDTARGARATIEVPDATS